METFTLITQYKGKIIERVPYETREEALEWMWYELIYCSDMCEWWVEVENTETNEHYKLEYTKYPNTVRTDL